MLRNNWFLFPLAILAGEVNLVGEADSDGKVIEDPSPQLQRCRERLDDTVHEANAYWTAWRRKSMTVPVASRAEDRTQRAVSLRQWAKVQEVLRAERAITGERSHKTRLRRDGIRPLAR